MELLILRGELPKVVSSYGYGYGYGYGSVSGSGSACGSGYGYGSESGSGYGYGSGYSDGYGYGSDGSGYGSGFGFGFGSKEYWLSNVPYFVAKWPTAQQARFEVLKASGATIAFWRSDAHGRACNGGKNRPVTPGLVETAKGPLNICSRGVLHATFIPPKWQGERWWIVALIGETVTQDDKIGALSREIVGECV